MRVVFSIIYYFLPEFTRNNVKVISKKQLEEGEMLNYFHADNLEVKYGGNRPNIESNFFPADFKWNDEALLTEKEVKDHVQN